MPMPNSSTASVDSCAYCAPASAGSFATSGARSQATRNSRRYSLGHSRVPIRSARSSSAIVVLRIRRDIGLRAGLLVAFGLEMAAQRSLAARVGARFDLAVLEG